MELRRVERDARRRERRQLLWLLASGAARTRQDAARQLGRDRETVSRWLGDYARVGRHNFCLLLNHLLGRPNLAFADLVDW